MIALSLAWSFTSALAFVAFLRHSDAKSKAPELNPDVEALKDRVGRLELQLTRRAG